MMYIKNKINKFNNTFSKDEKLFIIIFTIVTLLSIVMIFDLSMRIISPMFANLLNAIVGLILPGWQI